MRLLIPTLMARVLSLILNITRTMSVPLTPSLSQRARESRARENNVAAILMKTGLLLMLLGSSAVAQAEADAGAASQQALRKAQGLLRQLMEEKTALQAELAKLKQDSDAAKQQASKLEKELGATKTDFARLQISQQELNEKLQGESAERSRLAQSYSSLQGVQQSTSATLKQYQQDHALLLNAVQEREAWIAQCGEANKKLLELQQELLARYDDKNLWDVIRQNEPLTGIAKIGAENAAQEYRFKREDLRVQPFQGTAATTQVPGE